MSKGKHYYPICDPIHQDGYTYYVTGVDQFIVNRIEITQVEPNGGEEYRVLLPDEVALKVAAAIIRSHVGHSVDVDPDMAMLIKLLDAVCQ